MFSVAPKPCHVVFAFGPDIMCMLLYAEGLLVETLPKAEGTELLLSLEEYLLS